MLNNQQRSTVVESTLLGLLKRNNEDAVTKKRTVHVLLFHHMNGISEYVQQIKNLHDFGIRVRVCPDNEILNRFTVTELAQKIKVDDFITLKRLEKERDCIDQLFIPVMPFSVVSDILHFNDARAAIRIILWALMSGKRVTAYTAGADPANAIWKSANLNNGTAYLKMQMKRNLQQLKGFGIHLIDEADDLVSYFIKTGNMERKRVITAKTIQKEVNAENRTIKIDDQTIITPLARDVARKYEVTIVESRGG